MTNDSLLEKCDTLMLDMDGTLLDLAYDTYMWLEHIPRAYAEQRGVSFDEARSHLWEIYVRLQGQLDWYCLDHWSERLGLDIIGLHHAERERIGWLPGAETFLKAQAGNGKRVLLVTNSHRDTLALKSEVTGVTRYFDGIHTAHDFGHPKEERAFWEALAAAEDFDPARTLFVDDTERVLAGAAAFGIGHLLHVTEPDSSRGVQRSERFRGVSGVAAIR